MTPLLDVLVRRATATPHEPWLFGRHGVDWGWLSWAQTLDQVARTSGQFLAGERVPFDARRLPGALALELAIVAAGGVPEPCCEEDAPELKPASVRSRLGRWTPEPLPKIEAAPDILLEHSQLLQQAERLAIDLPPLRHVGGRPLLLVDPSLDPIWRRRGLALSLATEAAWAVESESFYGAALWARPTVVMTTPEELSLLREASNRKKKRWDRLRAAILVNGSEASTVGNLSCFPWPGDQSL